MEMDKMKTEATSQAAEEKEESSKAKELGAKVEEAEIAEYSQLNSPSEDVYTEAFFGASALQRQGRRKIRLLQAACVILSCVSLVLLLILIIVSLSASSDQTGSSSCPDLEVASTTCSVTHCDSLIPHYCPRCQYCPDDWLVLGRSCFFISTTRLSWEDSQRNCSIAGGSLAVVTNPQVQNYLTTKGKFFYWIGLRHQYGQWTWVNNTQLTRGFWSTSSPQPGCVLLNAHLNDSKNWMTASCVDRSYFICQLKI